MSGELLIWVVSICTIGGFAIALYKALPGKADPRLLEPPNCGIRVTRLEKQVHCIAKIKNFGSKECTVLSRDLIGPDGITIKLGFDEKSTRLPKPIPKDSIVEFVIKGPVPLEKLPIEPQQTSIDIKVIIKFDTKQIFEETFPFIISHYIQPKP